MVVVRSPGFPIEFIGYKRDDCSKTHVEYASWWYYSFGYWTWRGEREREHSAEWFERRHGDCVGLRFRCATADIFAAVGAAVFGAGCR